MLISHIYDTIYPVATVVAWSTRKGAIKMGVSVCRKGDNFSKREGRLQAIKNAKVGVFTTIKVPNRVFCNIDLQSEVDNTLAWMREKLKTDMPAHNSLLQKTCIYPKGTRVMDITERGDALVGKMICGNRNLYGKFYPGAGVIIEYRPNKQFPYLVNGYCSFNKPDPSLVGNGRMAFTHQEMLEAEVIS